MRQRIQLDDDAQTTKKKRGTGGAVPSPFHDPVWWRRRFLYLKSGCSGEDGRQSDARDGESHCSRNCFLGVERNDDGDGERVNMELISLFFSRSLAHLHFE